MSRPSTGGDGRPGLMVLGALGVVFGDIGTSPLYAMRTILGQSGAAGRAEVYGVTSTVVWTMVAVVTVLYVGLLLRADNEGEGGLLSLVALLRRSLGGSSGRSPGRGVAVVSVLGMVGAAAFLGDSVITPAISVLSAAEGVTVASPSLEPAVLPGALVLLAGVFFIQQYGSGRIGRFYGPVMVVWFAVLAVGGAVSIVGDPAALEALSPHWAVLYFVHDPLTAFLALGSVVLAVTGAEALYADLGHFGRAPITRAWLLIVLPALVLAYVGEGAEVVRHPSAAAEPFYAVVPGWATIPVVVVATLATVIASQAVIAGAFTVLHQAAGLGLFPWLRTRHTSREHGGQIYLPAANWTLAVVVLAVVAGFRSSDALSSAYGVAVTSTIVVTSTLFLVLTRLRAGRTTPRVVLAGVLVALMVVYLLATLPKVLTGGWLPLALGAVLLLVMTTWWSGRRRLRAARDREELDLADVLGVLDGDGDTDVRRVPGCAVFLTHDAGAPPIALRTMLEQVHALHEKVVLLSWTIEDKPGAPAEQTRVRVDDLGCRYDGVVGVHATFGYSEHPDVAGALEEAGRESELAGVGGDHAVHFVSVPIPRLTRGGGMARWRQRLFLLLDRTASDPVELLALPRERTVVIGRDVGL